jgi:hypothetical protein
LFLRDGFIGRNGSHNRQAGERAQDEAQRCFRLMKIENQMQMGKLFDIFQPFFILRQKKLSLRTKLTVVGLTRVVTPILRRR